MTDELKCLAHPCAGVLETNLYDASLTCSRCQFQVADELEYNALVAGRQAAIDDEKQNPWKAAIIQELIVDNILTEELERDPRKALAVAIDWNCKVALDPSVSKEAKALQQRAIDAAQARIDALEKQRASLFKEGAEAAVIAAERIAELERELSTKDDTIVGGRVMSKNTGGPAFPQPMAATPTGEMYCAVEKHPDFGGTALRDYFAAKAMQGILANPNKDYFVDHLAGEAYSIADAMLAERKKE